MNKITSLTYSVAHYSTTAAQALLQQYGLKQAQNHSQLIAGLTYIIKHYGEAGLSAVAALHPDKELILTLFGTPEKKSGADGSSSFCGCGFDGDNGTGDSGCGCSSADGGDCGCKKKKKCSCKKCSEKKSSFQGDYMDDWNFVTKDDLDAALSKAANNNSGNQVATNVAQQNNHTTLLLGGALLLTLGVVLMKH